MANLLDYLTWRGDINFTQSPLNPVDNIIFSQLSYLPLDGIVPGPGEKEGIGLSLAAKILTEKLQDSTSDFKSMVMYKEDPALISALGDSTRFGNCQLFGYVNHIDSDREVQFSALCIYTGDGSCFIAFRGTDFSFVGWKEDANMSFKDVIPAQLEAVKYLEKMASAISGPLRLGGHSKGGNLAIYAASNCGKNIQQRITEIYSNDAPGFQKNVIASEGFAAIKDRIRSFVPQSSVVGMVFEHGWDHTVIKSTQTGILQHDLYSWEVTRNNMVNVDKVDISSRFVDKTLKDWIGSLDYEHREQFLDALYAILNASETKSIRELEKSWFKAVGRMIKSLGNIDESKRNLIRKILRDLFRFATLNIQTLLKPEKE